MRSVVVQLHVIYKESVFNFSIKITIQKVAQCLPFCVIFQVVNVNIGVVTAHINGQKYVDITIHMMNGCLYSYPGLLGSKIAQNASFFHLWRIKHSFHAVVICYILRHYFEFTFLLLLFEYFLILCLS